MKSNGRLPKSKSKLKVIPPEMPTKRAGFDHPKTEVAWTAGPFNDRHPNLGENHWVEELALPPAAYEYLFVADRQSVLGPNDFEFAAIPPTE